MMRANGGGTALAIAPAISEAGAMGEVAAL
jgi:hypothetical protein